MALEPSETAQDAAWIEGIRQGNADAFAAMTRAYYPGLYDFALSYTRAAQIAEDLVQDVLLNVWDRRAAWRPPTTARAYLFRAVRNRALNHLRDRRTRRADDLTTAAALPQAAPDPEAQLRYLELLGAYHAALSALPERRRLVFRLSRLYGLTYAEIASVLGISVNTVRTQMAAALAHFRERLNPYLR